MGETKTKKNGRLEAPKIPLIFAFFFLSLWLVLHVIYIPRWGFQPHIPQVISGDEPHYLMVVNSILFDRDLALQEDYRRVREGGLEAGRGFRGRLLDHHTIMFDRQTGESDYWKRVFDMSSRAPCDSENCTGFSRLSQKFTDPSHIHESSSHPIGFPFLIAGMIALSKPHLEATEERSFFALLLLAWLGAVAVYLVARQAGLGQGASVAASSLLLWASPWLIYSTFFYSEIAAGTVLILALFALRADKGVWAGIAVVVAMAIKPPFVWVGIGWVVERFLARQVRSALILSGILCVGGLALSFFNFWQAGKWLISGNADPTEVWILSNPFTTLVDTRVGLWWAAPWTLVAFFGLVAAFFRRLSPEDGGLLRQVAIPTLFFLVFMSFVRFKGICCYANRYWIPFLPWFAVAAIFFAVRSGPWLRRFTICLALAGFIIAIPSALMRYSVWSKAPYAAVQKLFFD
jgi:hypothetical protein